MPSNFLTYLETNINITPTELNAVRRLKNIVTVKKGEFLLKAGQKCKNFYFVQEGLLRTYSTDENCKEYILHFSTDNWFIGDRESIFYDSPSVYNIQALEDSVLFEMNAAFQQTLGRNKSFQEFTTKLLHNHIRNLQNRIVQLMSNTAEKRYVDFIDMYPSIVQRVPQTMIAAFLGIAPESLSRVRKELAHKH